MDKTLDKAIEYLKSIGCKEIILFGSLADGTADESSDIDLAISDISPRTYFKTLATISSIVGKKVDLVMMKYILHGHAAVMMWTVMAIRNAPAGNQTMRTQTSTALLRRSATERITTVTTAWMKAATDYVTMKKRVGPICVSLRILPNLPILP